MSKKTEPLLNPYRQLEAWYLYYLYSLEYGERCLAALQAVEDKMMEYDELNKKHYPPTPQEKDPYNFWLDIPVANYIHRMVAQLKERVMYKRKHPQEPVNFESGLSNTFWRFKVERQHFFDPAQPQGIDPDAPGEINDLLSQAYILDGRIESLLHYRGGRPALSVVRDLYDGKVRDYYDVFVTEDKNDLSVQQCLKEPDVYPNYLIHWDETYPTGHAVTHTGVWLPEFDYMPMDYCDSLEAELTDTSYPQEKILLGPKEYGLIPPFDIKTETEASEGNIKSDTRWTFIEEIPPNTPGVPNNPLRLEDLRIPLTNLNQRVSAYGGEPARYKGLWFCPNMGSVPAARQQFKKGEILPEGKSERGVYIWFHDKEEAELTRTETYQQVVERYKKRFE